MENEFEHIGLGETSPQCWVAPNATILQEVALCMGDGEKAYPGEGIIKRPSLRDNHSRQVKYELTCPFSSYIIALHALCVSWWSRCPWNWEGKV